MKYAIIGAVLAATVLGALPASAEVVVRAGPGGVAVGERHHNHGYYVSERRHDRNFYRHHRRHHDDCRTVKTRTTTPSGRVIVRTRRTC